MSAPAPRNMAVLPLVSGFGVGSVPPAGVAPAWTTATVYPSNAVVSLSSGATPNPVFYNFRSIVALNPSVAPPATFSAPGYVPVVNADWTLLEDGEPYLRLGTEYYEGDVVSWTPAGSSAAPALYMCLSTSGTTSTPDSFAAAWKLLGVTSVNGSGITVSGGTVVATNLTAGFGVAKTASPSTTALALAVSLPANGNPAFAIGVSLSSPSTIISGTFGPGQTYTLTADSVLLATPLSPMLIGGVLVGYHLQWNSGPGNWTLELDAPVGATGTNSLLFGIALLRV